MAKKYSQEFKHQAVQLILEEGKMVAQAARELGLHENHEYQECLATYGMKGSMSRKGNGYDNACIESFHSILKKERIYLETFST